MKSKQNRQLYKITEIHPTDEKMYFYRWTLLDQVGTIDEEDMEDSLIEGYVTCTFHFIKPLTRLGEIKNV